MLRLPRPRPRRLAAPRSSAAKCAPPSATLIAKKFKNLRVFTPKPLRTKSTLHHWTCGAFGMRGRQVKACGRAEKKHLFLKTLISLKYLGAENYGVRAYLTKINTFTQIAGG